MPTDDSIDSKRRREANNAASFLALQTATDILVELGAEDALADITAVSSCIKVDDPDTKAGFMIYPGRRTMPHGSEAVFAWSILQDLTFSNSALARLYAAAWIIMRVEPLGPNLQFADREDTLKVASYYARFLCVGLMDISIP